MKITCITQPNTQPVSLEEAKNFCRILNSDDDALVSLLIDAATDYAQNVTGRQLCMATYEVVVGGNESPLRLPKAPLKAIKSVKCNGVDLNYTLHYDYDVALMEFSATNDVTITYECGYDVVPKSLQAWCLHKVSTFYENREGIVVGLTVAEVPSSMIDCVLDHYKVKYL